MLDNTSVKVPLVYCRMIEAVACKSKSDRDRFKQQVQIQHYDNQLSLDGVSLDTYIQVHQVARLISDNEGVSFLAGWRLPTATHGSLGVAFSSSANFYEAIRILLKYVRLRGDFLDLVFLTNASEATIEIRMDDAIELEQNALIQFVIGAILSIISSSVPFDMHLFRVQLSQKVPNNLANFSQVLPCRFAFKTQTNAVSFPKSLLEVNLPTADPVLNKKAIMLCDQEMYSVNAKAGFKDKVTRVIAQHLGKRLTVNQVAMILNVSPRTLQRKLAKEGVNFNRLKTEFLLNKAKHYIEEDKLTWEVAARLLGYYDAANLRRAYYGYFNQ